MTRIFFLLFYLVAVTVSAQVTPTDLFPSEGEQSEYNAANDTLPIQRKSFDTATVEELKADQDLNYKQPPTVAESLWDRIKYWIARFLEQLFEGATLTDVGRVLMYTLAIILLVGIILTLLKVNAFRVFYSGADQAKVSRVFHENIHEMDFEKLIRDATDKKDYRQGTRLILLYALKLLTDRHLIEWEAGKTNHDYVNELNVTDLKTGLNELSFYFDYAWYGNFPVTPEAFQRIQTTFTGWRQKLSGN